MNKLISVIVPTYNREAYIEEAINSVLSQKLPAGYSIEVIVVDDGSSDSTPELIARFKKVIYRRITNTGRPAVPRNIGLRMAKGDLVAFQDSDDLWVTNKLIDQVSTFDDPEVILSYGNAEIMAGDGRRTGKTVIEPGSGKSGHIFEELLKANIISTLTVMCRREKILDLGGFNESKNLRGVEDYELWLRATASGEVRYIDKPLALYRRHDENISHTIKYENNEHILSAYKALLRQPLKTSYKNAVRREMINLYINNSQRRTGLTRALNKFKVLFQKALLKTLGRI